MAGGVYAAGAVLAFGVHPGLRGRAILEPDDADAAHLGEAAPGKTSEDPPRVEVRGYYFSAARGVPFEGGPLPPASGMNAGCRASGVAIHSY